MYKVFHGSLRVEEKEDVDEEERAESLPETSHGLYPDSDSY